MLFGGGSSNLYAYATEDPVNWNDPSGLQPIINSPTGGPLRGCGLYGCGSYGASRDGGARGHQGIDFIGNPGDPVRAAAGGRVTNIGYAYENDLSYRIVDVTTFDGYRIRHFYTDPCVEVGDYVEQGQRIGRQQELGSRYPGIEEHIHLGVMHDGAYLDPTNLVRPDGWDWEEGGYASPRPIV